MAVPETVYRLVERFDANLDAYKSGRFDEADVRNEFINPLFRDALGWDMSNEAGRSPAYREVISEDRVKVGGGTGRPKAPDYGFYAGGERRFFLEAKKPSVDIAGDLAPAVQLRRYAWSAKLPLSLLTDFEELAVYDCRFEPAKQDKPATARLELITYDQYPDRWDDIAGLFSREAVLDGSLEKYAEANRKKRGTETVDAAFLREIEGWREMLARDLAARNDLNRRQLNYAVQLTIDRIIFLRMAEDRGVEEYERLKNLLNGGANGGVSSGVYEGLCELFREADDRYNSGLFHFRTERDRSEEPDTLTPTLALGDEVLQDIIGGLYYPESPYEFSVLPVDVLGQVYEQFLGSVIHLEDGHKATVEQKPEVRKAGGVYYTPTYIVDYIVENTVGKLLEGKRPGPRGGASKLKIVDPACGSGSFLIGAYEYLLNWHRDRYLEDGPDKHRDRLYEGRGGNWHLTIDEKKRILLNNIYGVDIDPQAVEVTKLSLLLKVLEGESEQSLQTQLRMFQERALPDLRQNIKCGNSLIGPDFYVQQDMALFEEDDHYRINVFDWQDNFPQVFEGEGAGFDAVIGNPPYLRIQGLQEHYESQIEYFVENYHSAVKRFDVYLLFCERGYELLKKDGLLGYICPHKFLNSDFGSGLRDFLIQNVAVEAFVSFGNNLIFDQASTYTGILLLRNGDDSTFLYYEFGDMPPSELANSLGDLDSKSFATYDLDTFTSKPWVLTNARIQKLLNKLSEQPNTLGDVFAKILVGVQSGIDDVHILEAVEEPSNGLVTLYSERASQNIVIENDLVKPLLRGEDVHRYAEPEHSHYCIYPYQLVAGKTKIIEEEELKEKYPHGYEYLAIFREELRAIRIKQKTNPKYWYSCHRSRDMSVFESDRIVTPEISLGCNMTISQAGTYHNTKVYSLVPEQSREEFRNYWLGILNSKILWWFLANTGYVLRGGYFVFKTNYLSPFPIRTIDFSDAEDAARHEKMVELVERMLELYEKLAEAKIERERTVIGHQISATDKQIDNLVYELYGLTDEEVRIVEEATVR